MTEWNKDMFIREIAHRADFTIGDIKIVWGVIEDIFKDIIANEDELKLVGLFHLYVRTIRPRMGCKKGYTPIQGGEYQEEMLPEAKRIVSSWSKSLLSLIGKEEESEEE